jgi:hypothetical protein
MRLLDFIVCDDIRHETGNKVSLMGLYSNLIIQPAGVLTWPIALRLGFFVRCMIESTDSEPERFHLELIKDGKTLFDAEGDVKITGDVRMFAISIVHPAFPIPGPGTIVFRLVFTKGDKVLNELHPDYQLDVTLDSTGMIQSVPKQEKAKKSKKKR